MESKILPPTTFILSTGRTGTQFFSRYLTETCPSGVCLHEPHPSRRFKWYSNFYLESKLSESFVANQYLSTRKKIFKSFQGHSYIESSNFIYGCIDPIASVIDEVKVIHIIRHPVKYIISHLDKGFWNGIKGFTARHIPGWLEFIDQGIKNSNDPVMILAARWIYVNEVIGEYERRYPFLSFRFEDLFSNKDGEASKRLNQICRFVDCEESDEETNLNYLSKPANQSKKSISDQWIIEEKHFDYLERHGGKLLSKFNYDLRRYE